MRKYALRSPCQFELNETTFFFGQTPLYPADGQISHAAHTIPLTRLGTTGSVAAFQKI